MKFNNRKRYKYNLSEKDFIGDIEGFPIEIVEKMLEEQELQGNTVNISTFQQYKNRDKYHGGFDWIAASDGSEFWGKVVNERDFDYFFKKYPK